MATLKYLQNVDPMQRFTIFQYLKDDDSMGTIVLGRTYEISTTEASRISPYCVLVASSDDPSPNPGEGDFGGASSWKTFVPTFASLPELGDDGDARVVLADETQTDSPVAIYVWRTDEWTLTAGSGGGGGGDPDPGEEEDLPFYGTDLATLGEGNSTRISGVLVLGVDDLDDMSSTDDFDLINLWWFGNRWNGREENLMRQTDTWAVDLSNYSAASRSGYQRPVEPLPYGRGHSFLTADVTVGDAVVPINNGTSFTVAPFKINQYTITPTGFSSNQFTGCTWSPSGGGEVLPDDITLVRQGSVGGYGLVPRLIHRLGELYAKGFAIQCRASAFMVGSADDHALTVGTYLMNFDSGDDVPAIATTPTAGLGMISELTGPSTDNGAANREAERAMAVVAASWADLTGVSTPTKEFGYPIDYAKMGAAGDTGEYYNHQVWYRVVST